MFGFCLQTKCLWLTAITNELYSFTMQNFQVIVLSVWEPTDKISYLHDVTLMKKLKSILSNNRPCLKQAFQGQTLPKVNQQPVSKIHLVSQKQPHNLSFFVVIFLDNNGDF